MGFEETPDHNDGDPYTGNFSHQALTYLRRHTRHRYGIWRRSCGLSARR
jgi:hypothetical protein